MEEEEEEEERRNEKETKREKKRRRWTKQASSILARARKTAFPESSKQLPQTHVLDLAQSGVIKPHVDSVRVCIEGLGNPSNGMSPFKVFSWAVIYKLVP